MAEPDSGGFSEQTATPAESDSATSEPGFEFGAGIKEDPGAEEYSQGATPEQPDAADTAGGTTPAADATQEAADDGGGLRLADYTQKSQALADERRAWEADRQQKEAAITAREAALEELRGAAQPPEGQQSTLVQYAEVTLQRLSDPNLTPEQRASLQSDLQGVQVVQAAVDEGVKAALTPILAQLEEMAPKVEQAGQQAGALSEANQQQHLAIAKGQMEEAVALFGQETWDKAGKMVAPLFFRGGQFVPALDPVTGAEMTMAEMVGRMSGKDIEAARAAQNGNRAARQVARAGATPRGTTPAADIPTGPQTRDQAIAQMRAADPTLH